MDISQPPRRQYDLEERTALFAIRIRDFLYKVPRDILNTEYIRQLARSSGSIGANYIEANDALGRNDFLVKIKTSRREAKESVLWLRLLNLKEDRDMEKERAWLLSEASQFVKILSAIIRTMNQKNSTMMEIKSV